MPFLVLREMKGLSASNTLYVVRFISKTTRLEKAALGLLLLTSVVRKELSRRARAYADGLLKFEPSDLGSVRIPVVIARRDVVALFRRATEALLEGCSEDASSIADAWLARCTKLHDTPPELVGRPLPAALRA